MELREMIDEGVKRELDRLEKENEKRYRETKKRIENIRKLLE